MKSDVRDQLTNLIGAYDAKLAEAERVEDAKRAAHEAFPKRFAALKTATIRPALEEFAEVLNGSGHEAAVNEQEESSSTAGGIKWAAISLRIVPKPHAHRSTPTNPSAVEVTFSANRNDGKITVSSTNTMSSAGGSLGKRASYEVESVTADVIAEHVLQTLKEAFAIRELR